MERLLLSSEPGPPSARHTAVVREAPAPPYTTAAIVLAPVPHPAAAPLTPLEQRIKGILEHKGQVILYGPPGTGKTFSARQAAGELVARELFSGRAWASLSERERRLAGGSIEFITFHPAYAYEDFIEGYRPVDAQKGGPAFELRDGVFLEICDRARLNPGRHCILIVDEINRGNVAAILGELITLLESDKRDSIEAVLPLSRRRFRVPHNVWIVGTMNTADRSIALLDAALRRRFGFVEMLPDPDLVAVKIDNLSLSALLTEINARIRKHITRNARELQIGHAYLMRAGKPIQSREALLAAFRDEILPLLAEYCFENYATLARILGDEIIDAAGQIPNARVLLDVDRLHRALQRLITGDPVRIAEQAAAEEGDAVTDFPESEGEAIVVHNPGRRRI